LIDAGKFFVPGPTEVRPEVLDAMRRPLIFHRNAEMEALMRRVTVGLSAVFGTKRPAHVITGSGTSAMEMSIRNGASKNVLSIVHGDFGERFAKLAEACGRRVTRLKAEPGDVVPLDEIRDALRSGSFDTVLATHSETALGVLADIKGIGAIVREQSDCLLFVDAVSSAGATPIEMDAWGVDAVVTASQKSLALPPGLAFAAVSDRFLSRAKGMPDRGAYLDIFKYEEFTAKAQSPTTPAVSLLFALDRQMQDVAKETLAGRYARHVAMANACTAWVERVAKSGVDIAVMARKDLGSPSVTCIRTPWKTSDVLARARAEGFELGGGQAEFTNSTFRVGHMGDHTLGGMTAMLGVLEGVLNDLGKGE
jgi:aspartate aminotransferase-like enzyme